MQFKKEEITKDLNVILVCIASVRIHAIDVIKGEQILARKGEWFSCYHSPARATIWGGFDEHTPDEVFAGLRHLYKNEKANPTLLAVKSAGIK